MPRVSNSAKPKKVAVELIPRDSPIGFPMYGLLEELIEQRHPDKRAARIGLMWNTAWTPDVDGNVIITKATIATDFQRELRDDIDVVIQVLHGWWKDERVTDFQRRLELDAALCAFEPVLDKNGDHAEDERERLLWRHRGPDIQTYTAIVEEYGIEAIQGGQAAAAAIRRSPSQFRGCELCLADDTCPPGWLTVENRVKRCTCWTEPALFILKAQTAGCDDTPTFDLCRECYGRWLAWMREQRGGR